METLSLCYTDDNFVETIEELWPDESEALIALLKVLEFDGDTDDIFIEGSGRFMIEGTEYLVLEDYEADQRWDEHIEQFIDEIVMYEIPSQYHFYFDRDLYIQDYKMSSTRGADLSTDGEELYLDGNLHAFCVS